MAKTLMYRLFGLGRFYEPLATALQREGVVLLEEGIPGSVTYVNFRAPGRFSGWKRQWYTASIALTATRLVATRYAATAIDVPVADDRFRGLNFSLERGDTLVISFDASLFHDDWSGSVTYRFRTPQASTFLELLRERSAAGAPATAGAR
jgi:hypothetical protein